MYLPRWMKIKTTNNFCMFTADYAIKRYWSLVNKRSRIAYCSIDNIFVLMSCEMKSAYQKGKQNISITFNAFEFEHIKI